MLWLSGHIDNRSYHQSQVDLLPESEPDQVKSVHLKPLRKKKKAYKPLEGDHDKTKKTLRLLCKKQAWSKSSFGRYDQITLKEATDFHHGIRLLGGVRWGLEIAMIL